jgi:hypothetical protein
MHGDRPEAAPGVNAVSFAWGRAPPAGVELDGMRSTDVR